MKTIADLGGPTWFKLGDGDLAMHVERTRRLRAGEGLTEFCACACKRFGIAANIVPMSDDRVRTVVDTDRGTLAFQEYFVREQCQPGVRAIRFKGVEDARPSAAALAALTNSDLGGIVICPSNPYLSIDPLLAVPGLEAAIRSSGVPVIAITPIIAGKAVKGPLANIMRDFGITPAPVSVARHYAGLIDGFVLDVADAEQERELTMSALVVNTLMSTLDDKVTLARACLNFCDSLRSMPGGARSAASAEIGS
jgi:LPPG:FO 2-phospho-L-lactate transferase